MAKSKADRFLYAFNQIEKSLQQVLEDAGSDIGYKGLVAEAAKRGYLPASTYQQRLITFGYLRNAIVHNPESSDGEAIATPRNDVVQEIEEIAEIIEAPPTVDSICSGPVYTVLGNCLIRDVAIHMKEQDFSQAPVEDYEGNFRTLLTTNTVARWFAEALQRDTNLDEATVDDVLDYREREDNYELLPQDATLFRLVDMFDAKVENHIPPRVAIVTKDGSKSSIEGIATPFDLPLAFRKLSFSRR